MSRPRSISTMASAGRLEEDDVVRALAIPVDLVREPAAAPRGDLHDLAAGGRDLAGGAVDDRLGAVVGDVGSEDEHEFVSAHAPGTLLPMGCAPLTAMPAARSGKETGRESSTEPVGYPLDRTQRAVRCRAAEAACRGASMILLIDADAESAGDHQRAP